MIKHQDKEVDYYHMVANQAAGRFTDDWEAYKISKKNYDYKPQIAEALLQEQVRTDDNVIKDDTAAAGQGQGGADENIHEADDKEMEVYEQKGDPPPAVGANRQQGVAPLGEASEGDEKKGAAGATMMRDISCDINAGRQVIPCKAEGSQVFIPFSFLEKEFEVSGHLDEKKDAFMWVHSQAKIFRPKGRYNPTGVFTYFENYQVESRDRVKCISGKYGVPISTQWSSQGYFYPIQIAQFGLSHFSKFLVEGEPHRLMIEDAEDIRASWRPSVSLFAVSQDSNDLIVNNVVQMENPGNTTKAFTLRFEDIAGVNTNSNVKQLVLSWDMKISKCPSKCALKIIVTVLCDSKPYYLHYVNEDFLIDVKDNKHFYYGLGQEMESDWQHVIRDVHIDTQKGLSFKSTSKRSKSHIKIAKSKVVLESFTIHVSPGVTFLLDNVTVSNAEHMAQFYQAADWFVLNQDEMGGWPIPVKRKFSSDFPAVLEPGWNSAMSQGHALSLLSRAYYFSNSSAYKNALIRAVSQIFELSGLDKGVQTRFLDKYVWYEEYPTSPSSFVLNGFMYALLGLYDLKMIKVSGGASTKAEKLYEDGIQSLKMMLPLFDTGSGTMYDLRHFTVPGVTPNLARIDYHVTHINQLLTFATFEQDPIFKTTAERWIGYTQGIRAPHN
ncbi:D-glucuronyl C5-epimerase [Orchesella cincta]|uniref:heparosan-N-sulfate-glucuronate 5-epimerase n=1 Tax=Orchesella cincta TaxID=48709 RepID=A0A1D2MXS0_ORCCI|nr:D-glucuronyl C5-epimerase [Orchesella cincta]